MNDRQKSFVILQEGCQYITELMEEKAEASYSLTHTLLFEAFGTEDFRRMIEIIGKANDQIPKEMSKTRLAIKRGLKASREAYASLKKGDKDKFAKTVSTLMALQDALVDSFEALRAGKEASEMMRKLDGQAEEDPSALVSATLSSEDRATLEAVIKKSFQADGLLGSLFGMQKDFFGLTAGRLFRDLMELSVESYQKVMKIETPDMPKDAVEQVVDAAEEDSDDGDEGATDGDGEGTEESQAKSSSAVSLADIKGELDAANFDKKQIRVILSVLRNNKVQMESKKEKGENLILERWRRMAGISQESDDE